MVTKLLNRLRKSKQGSELLTELDVTRVVGEQTPSEETPQSPSSVETPPSENDTDVSIDLDTWKKNDIDLLQSTWQSYCDAPEDEDSAHAFKSAIHNLHGASGAYGGGALGRITQSLQGLLEGIEDLQADAALINLHVQACRATLHGDGDSADDIAEAVCSALEGQVEARLHGAYFSL